MKKILFIGLIIMFCIGLFGQTKIIRGQRTPLTEDINTLEVDVTIVENDINTLTTNTSGVVGWTLNSNSDTVIIEFGGYTWKLLAVDSDIVDNIAPTIVSAEVGIHAEDTIIIIFSEAMDEDSIPAASSITILEDGVTFGIGTPFIVNDTLKIPLDSVVEIDHLYTFSYTRPGLLDFQDVAHNKLLSVTTLEVVNNAVIPSSIYAYMLFDNNDDDEMGVMTFTWTGSESYRTTGTPPQGTHSTNTAAGGAISTTQSHDLGTSWSFTGWWNGGNDTDTSPRYLLDLDGADIWIDYTDGAMYIEGSVGGATFQSDLIADVAIEWKWVHIGITYDGVNGRLRTYLDGVNKSNDSIVGAGADANGIVDIAWNGTTNKFYGDYDDVHFYKNAVLTDADILWQQTHRGVPVGGRRDIPIPSDSIDILWEEDWEDFSTTTTHAATVPTGIPNADISAYMTNLWYLGSDDANNATKADNADIVVFDGSQVIKSWYLEGRCCTGAASDTDVSNGGTGIHMESWITNQATTYSEVYVSYNVYIQSDFENSAGFKTPGFRSASNYVEINLSRLMVTDWIDAAGDLNPQFYNRAHWTAPSWVTTWGSLSTRPNSKNSDISTGQWVNITIRSYIGTERGVNGRTEYFINGIYSGQSVSSIPFRDTGGPAGWNIFSFETFMGGDNTAYISPQDQWMIHDEIVVFKYKDGIAGIPYGNTPSVTGRDITGTLMSIPSLNFPR
jgi:hypothetical protein